MASLQVQTVSVPLILPNRQIVYRGIPNKQNVVFYQGNFTNNVWDRTWPPPPPGGGQIPFAYILDGAEVKIKAQAAFTFPPEWAQADKGGGACMMELKSGNNLVLRTGPLPLLPLVKVDSFQLKAPLVSGIFGPFKSGLQWSASMICCNPAGVPAPGIQPIKDSTNMTLEAFFFMGSLHYLFQSGDQSGHRVELIRDSVIDADTLAGVNTLAGYKLAAVAKIANSVWQGLPTRLAYDVIQGAGCTGVGGYGGNFWLSQVFPNQRRWTNCYDLAAITSAWCASLGTYLDTSLVLETVWGYSGEWFGYVTEGPLFGWSIDQYDLMRCNNPFFGSSGYVHYDATGLYDTNRQPFGNHAWVEVVTQAAPLALRVLEVCHARYNTANPADPILCKADIFRVDWWNAAINAGALTITRQGHWNPMIIDRNGLGYKLKPPPPGQPNYPYYVMNPGYRGLQSIND